MKSLQLIHKLEAVGSCKLLKMGLCYSRAGWLATSTDTYTDCSELSTSNSKSLIYESPRWSAETGDKGKLGNLLYKRRRRRRFVGTPDLFSARLEGLLGGIHNFHMKHSPGDFAFASFVGSPFVRNLETQGMDALARSYAISAAKASARNAFLLLQERDKSEAVEVFSSMIKIQTPDQSSGDEVANEIIIVGDDDDKKDDDDDDDDDEDEEEVSGLEINIDVQEGVQLDSPEDGDEIEVLEQNSPRSHGEASRSSEFTEFVLYDQDIDLGAPYKAGMQRAEPRSFFESCFPATGRWASVVNAAMHSACLSRSHSSPARHNCTEVSEPPALSECLEFEIRHEYQSAREMLGTRHSLHRPDGSQNRHITFEGGRFSGSETCSEVGHACVGCCGSRASGRYSDSETCSEAGHACVGCCGSKEDAIAASVTSRSRTVKSETGSSSDIIQLPHGKGAADQLTALSPSTSHALQDIENKGEPGVNMYTPTHGLRVNTSTQREDVGLSCTSMCSSSERVVPAEQLQQLERVDSDLDAFFSFPSSPSAKILEERGSGHIIEETKSAKLMEDMGMRRILDDELTEDEEEFEGPRSRAESPRGGNALSKGAFGSPFPVLGASGRKTRPVVDKKLKLFSLDRANTAALAKKHGTNSDGVLTSSSDSYLDTSSSSLQSRQRDAAHDWDDYSSDLFEIQDMQPMTLKAFSGVNLSCLPLKKSFGCSHEACDGFSEVESASSYNSSEFASSRSFSIPL